MSYDSKTNTVTVIPGDDFVADIGVQSINRLSTLAQDPAIPLRMKDDWKIVEAWLGSAERPLSLASNARIARAWRAYYAAGIAPSLALQPTFDKLSGDYGSSDQSHLSDKLPKDLTGVFDRLLATENQIKEKNLYDRVLAYDSINTQEPENRLAENIYLLRSFSRRLGKSWARLRSRTFLGWDFVSLILAATSLFCMVAFIVFVLWAFTYSV